MCGVKSRGHKISILAVVGKDELVWRVTAGQAAATCGERGLLAKDLVEGVTGSALQCDGVVDFCGDRQALQTGNILVQDTTCTLPHVALSVPQRVATWLCYVKWRTWSVCCGTSSSSGGTATAAIGTTLAWADW